MIKIINKKQGFILPLVITIIAVLAIGGVIYLAPKKKVEAPVVVDTNIEGKESFHSQEEQTKARERAQGISNFLNEHGILVELVKQYPSSSKYKLPINIKGYVSDNTKWRIFEGEAGVITIHGIVAGKDKVIGSSPLTLKDFDYDKKPPFYFDLTVGDRQWMSELDNENGYVLFSEAGAKDGDIIDAVKVPIVFDIGNTQPTIKVISPNGGESIPFSQVTMAGELYFDWVVSGKIEYVPTLKFKAYVIDMKGNILRDDVPLFMSSTTLNSKDVLFRMYFDGDRNLKVNTKYRIKVCDYIQNQEYCDSSDDYFTID